MSTSLLKLVSLSALQIALELLCLGIPVLTISQALSMYKFCFLVFLPLLCSATITVDAVLFVIFKFHSNN
jgi:hypothetical protein